jgi:hypothetical protein
VVSLETLAEDIGRARPGSKKAPIPVDSVEKFPRAALLYNYSAVLWPKEQSATTGCGFGALIGSGVVA